MTSRAARRRPRAARLDDRDWRRVCAFAARHSVAPAEGLRRLVLLGLQAAESAGGGTRAELEEPVRRLLGLLERVGPAMVGLPHLLAYWATRDEGDNADADAFMAEFNRNAGLLWAEALRRHGVDPAGAVEGGRQDA